MKANVYIVKTRILTMLVYRFDVVSGLVLQCLIVFATAFFWIATYQSKDSIIGVEKEQMLTYTIMAGVLAVLYTNGVQNRMIDSIRKGNISLDMLKPINIFGMYLSEDIGSLVVSFFQNATPLVLVSCLLIHIPAPKSTFHFSIFIICAIMGFVINWILSAMFGLIAFWAINIGPLREIKNHLVRILSGSIIPLWFFPHWMQSVLGILPFQYIFQFPLSVYIGKLNGMEMFHQMGIQVTWVFILYVAFYLLQKKVLTSVLVQGG